MKEIAVSENIENFSDNNYIYVDKTEYIYNLISQHERVFFSRPRRFGKSLTINSIGTLFEKGVDPYFKGTWIYKHWQQPLFPVMHLSFLRFSTTDIEVFKKSLFQTLEAYAVRLDIKDYIKSSDPIDFLRNLFMAMPDGMQIVLLIDEYDCQLSANINNHDLYDKFRTFFREFYGVLKGEKHIRFLAVTGVTRLKDISIFSVGSDIEDLTYEHAFSQMIGFTRDEIKKFYLDYLKIGVVNEKKTKPDTVTDEDIEKLLDRMEEQYDGYCFDSKFRRKVFSTLSVNRFLQDLRNYRETSFGDYWYQSGGVPSILKNYLESHEIDVEKFLLSDIEINYDAFMNPATLIEMDENVLMCQTGYLTLKSEIQSNRKIRLGPANKEVNSALNSLLSGRFFDPDAVADFYNDSILKNGSPEEIIKLFNSILATISYEKYPVENESVLRALIQMYLVGLRYDVRVEQQNYKGRSDLLVNLDKRRIVIEFKFSKDGSYMDELLKEAVNQVQNRQYGTENPEERELIRIACVFNGAPEVRQISLYQVC